MFAIGDANVSTKIHEDVVAVQKDRQCKRYNGVGISFCGHNNQRRRSRETGRKRDSGIQIKRSAAVPNN